MIYGIGLMSGTSADGVSAVLVRLSPQAVEPVMYQEFRYTAATQTWILGLGKAGAREIARAGMILGEIFAHAALRALAWARRKGIRVRFIASHGQTVCHDPGTATLQIGEPAVIAERTGLPVVSGFRPRDIAAGGEGAPLVPFFDHFVFSGRAPVALLNIGGIANVTLVTRRLKEVRAFDTGPGNCMIDEAARIATRGALAMDPQGQLASQGAIDGRLLQEMMKHPFLKRRPPKSACRSDFVPFPRRGKALDVVATVTYFAAVTMAQGVRDLPARSVIVSGGGVYNRTLMGHLRSLLFPRRVETSESVGWHPMAREAACMALLGYRMMRGESNHVPSATGARGPRVLGQVVPGRGGALRLPN